LVICVCIYTNLLTRYLGTAQTDRNLFIILEFVPGGSIASMLTQFGAFSEVLIK
jgi:mitogen-activated protein kinase kinase kinase